MIKIVNPWGNSSAFDAQRSDLWNIDLKPVINIVMRPGGVDVTAEYANYSVFATNEFSASSYARKITFPETSISALKVLSGTQPFNLPGYDEPINALRIAFIQETTGIETDNVGEKRGSGIYNLLLCWHMLAMAGQKRFAKLTLPLADATSKPTFMCDLRVDLLKGSEYGDELDSSSSYTLARCWISDLQLPDYDYRSADVATIIATLQVGAIVPLTRA